MDHPILTYLHLAMIVPAFLLGTFLLLNRKGTRLHRALGKMFMVLMLAIALSSLLMPVQRGPDLFGHFGMTHLFALLVLYYVPSAYLAARRGDISRHRGHIAGVYVGALLIAGGFAIFTPGRLVNEWLFGVPLTQAMATGGFQEEEQTR